MTKTTALPTDLARHDELLEAYYPGSDSTFGETAALYDWGTPLPLPKNRKSDPPIGTTGWTGVPLEPAQGADRTRRINRRKWGSYEVALRLPDGVIALDVDNYVKADGETIRTGLKQLGYIEQAAGAKLPPTYTSTGRGIESGAGHKFYRVKREITRQQKPHDQGDVQLLHLGHRYAVVWPSVVVDEHAERVYRWYDQNDVEMDLPPSLDQIPYLPEALEEYFFQAPFSASRVQDYDTWDPSTDEVTEEQQKAARAILEWSLDPDNVERGVDEAGGRNNWLNKTAHRLLQFCYAGALPDETPESIGDKLQDALGAVGEALPAHEAAATLQSAQTGAEAFPTVPVETNPWPDAEDVTAALAARADILEQEAKESAKSSWADVDLLAVFDGLKAGTLEVPKPTVGHLEGSTRSLFYAGATNMIFGDSNSGKTWTALLATVEVLREGGHVFYVDYEGNLVSMVNRLNVLGVERRHLKRLHMKRPEDAFTPYARALLEGELDEIQPELVVIDSMGEALALDGKNPNADEEVAMWFRGLANTAANAGACVVLIDHLPKSSDGRFSIGSQRKRSALKGAQYRQEMVNPFSKNEVGYAKLVVTKDREGTATSGAVVAELMVNTADGGGIELWEPDPEHTAPASDLLPDRIKDYLKANPGCSKKALKSGVQGNDHQILDALDELLAGGAIRVEKDGQHKTAPQKVYLA